MEAQHVTGGQKRPLRTPSLSIPDYRFIGEEIRASGVG
jgi:hypothetical protein